MHWFFLMPFSKPEGMISPVLQAESLRRDLLVSAQNVEMGSDMEAWHYG